MNIIDRAVLVLAPEAGLRRLQARQAARVLMNYDAATGSRRGSSWRLSGADADGAAARRNRITYVARDMIRNTPYAARARQVIVNNVVGDGIIPSITGVSDLQKRRWMEIVKAHIDTTAIDYYGRQNLYGLEQLALATVVDSGEALVRIHRRPVAGSPIQLQLQVLEPDHLDTGMDGRFFSRVGNYVHEGIEYDQTGRRVAYHLYREHPGSARSFRAFSSERIPASQIVHIYRQDRPGQMRGVSWLAPVAMTLQDLRDYVDAQIMRQKIAACFAAFRVDMNSTGPDTAANVPATLSPGAIVPLGPGEDIRFAQPPSMDGHDAFVRDTLREVAAGLGITYEALSGDLSTVNYSSGRMGRMEMDRNIGAWQWTMLIPQFLDRVGAELLTDMRVAMGSAGLANARIEWTPPARVIVDPTKEVPAMNDAIRGGLTSWSRQVRALGYDPEVVAAEISSDNEMFDRLGLSLDSDGRRPKNGGAQPQMEAPDGR